MLSLTGGAVAGIAANAALNYLNDTTGLVDDVGSLIDDVLDIF